MKKAIKKVLRNIRREFMKSDLERFLEGSQNIADLEHRTKLWQEKQHRANNVLGGRYY
jgi:hypothetical protein